MFAVKIREERRISTTGEPCNDDPNYNYYDCFESFFYKKRGCQYPWNVYDSLDVPICTNFTKTVDLIYNKDRNLGYSRYYFGHSERLTRTEMQCPVPCHHTKYELDYGSWDIEKHSQGITFRSIQIGFSDFMIVYAKQYKMCDFACILGQLGGNLGFFLGGSVLAGLDFIFLAISKLFHILELKHQGNQQK